MEHSEDAFTYTSSATAGRKMERRNTDAAKWVAPLALMLLNGLLFWSARGDALRGYADFSGFYSTGVLVRSGHAADIYNPKAQRDIQAQLYPHAGVSANPLQFYTHPPFEALLFSALAAFDYSHAYHFWAFINLAILISLPFVLAPCIPALMDRYRPFVLFAFLSFFPAMIALLQGQDSILLLLIFAFTYRSLRGDKELRAGALLGLGLFRFQITIPFALFFLAQRRWKALLGFTAVALLLFSVTLGLIGWQGTLHYVQYLRGLNVGLAAGKNMEVRGMFPEVMPNIRGFLFTCFAKVLTESRLQFLTAAVSLAILGWTLFLLARTRRAADDHLGLAFSLQLIASLLVSFHLYVHDLSLLALALLLLLNDLASERWEVKIGRIAVPSLTAFFYFTPLFLALQPIRKVSLYFLPLLALALLSSQEISRSRGPESVGRALNRPQS